MTSRFRRPRRLAALSPVIGLWLATLWAQSAAAATTYTIDLYFDGAYEHQIDSRTCTAASVAMMENMTARRDLNLSQSVILRYEQSHDALNDATQLGSDPLGWARAATWYSQSSFLTKYRWEAYATKAEALQRAASQLATTSRPVGLLVAHGTHAVVLTGIITIGDPRKQKFTIAYVYVSDPNGYKHYRYTASSVPLNTYLETDATAWYDSQWYGKYVLVVPQDS